MFGDVKQHFSIIKKTNKDLCDDCTRTVLKATITKLFYKN